MSKLLDAKKRLLEDDIIVPSKKYYNDDAENSGGRKSHREESKKKKKEKKSKKRKKSKKKERRHSSSSSSDSSDESDSWVEKPTVSQSSKTVIEPRDDWMKMTGSFSTFTRKDLKPDKPKEKGQIDAYNPSQCSRELNPYWKNGGTGLPSAESKSDRHDASTSRRDKYNTDKSASNSKFKRPDDDNAHDSSDRKNKHQTEDRRSYESSKKNWQKKSEPKRSRSKSPTIQNDNDRNSSSKSDMQMEPFDSLNEKHLKTDEDEMSIHYLTDEQMNALGAKIVKAEIIGNSKAVAELTSKLEKARLYKKEHPEGPPGLAKKDNAVMLTMTDDKGNTRPLTKSLHAGDNRSKGGKKTKETHSADGDRMRFFADDDNYSLKDMFQKEKYENANESEEQFANIISKHRNPNDDLEDIFAENIMKVKSDEKTDAQNMNKAISQHKRIQRSLDNCDHCIESSKMIKHMIVSLGSKAYISLPPRKSLTEGHCIISTNTHIQSSTFADEDVWSEILMYRKALTNMFNSRDEDVVFFETASYLHKHPHMVIDCVPVPRDVGDTAPIYFKKGLLECEAEWSTNKKVVDLKNKDIRRGIPKGLPYFWVDFGMDPGFAHVIEDQELFPKNFAQEIIGGMLDLHHSLWRKPHLENFETQRKKVLQFTEIWKPFDFKLS